MKSRFEHDDDATELAEKKHALTSHANLHHKRNPTVGQFGWQPGI
jgi:hypothetical protein